MKEKDKLVLINIDNFLPSTMQNEQLISLMSWKQLVTDIL